MLIIWPVCPIFGLPLPNVFHRRPDQSVVLSLCRFWSDHMESHSTAAPSAWGSSMSDLFTQVKLGSSRRQFLQTAAAAGGAAVLPAFLGMGEAFAQSASDTL